MKWSWVLGRVQGIKIQVHWTFSILLVWVGLIHAARGASTADVVAGIMLILAVFACVVLHELGHALTAKRFGINTRDITLLPIGGVARLERMPDEPYQELIVAAAGPAVNVVIAGILALALLAVDGFRPIGELALVGGNFAVKLMWVNVLLVAFNLLPAFPMDGGRILRALLASRLDYGRATRIAATIGQGMAVLFGLAGLFGNPFLLLIAIFVFLGAQAEAEQVGVRMALEGVPVADAMMTRFDVLAATNTLQDAIDELIAGSQQDFPVVEDGRVVGLLLRQDLVKAIKAGGREQRVGDVMRKDCALARVDEPVFEVIARMRSARCPTIPVMQDGTLVGLLTLENVGELMMVEPGSGRIER